jgi:OmpA-OmpF porin, OOP family
LRDSNISEENTMRKALLLCALAAPALAAADQFDQWYVTPQIGAISPDYKRSLEDQNWLFGLSAGRELNQFLNLELNFNGTRLADRNAPGHLNSYATSLDLLGVFNRGGVVSPFLIGGAGVLRNDFNDQFIPTPNQTHFLVEGGVGLFLNLWQSADETSSFALRPEILARWDEPGRDAHLVDDIAMLGFQFSFGGTPVARAAPPPAPPPPPPPPPPPQPAPPPPAAAPAPPPPETHHIIIPTRGSVTLEGVTFAFNSADLTDSSRPVLDDTASGLKQHPGLKVEIQGYTDSVGSARYNVRLSQRRANAVRDYLVQQGVDPGQLTARGYGKADPVASNATAEGRAMNRRVVLFVLSNPGAVEVQGQGSTR